MTEDDNRRVIFETISYFTDLIDSLGPACIDQSIDRIAPVITKLLSSQIIFDDN
jgi:hypothetical protein